MEKETGWGVLGICVYMAVDRYTGPKSYHKEERRGFTGNIMNDLLDMTSKKEELISTLRW